MSNAPTTPDAAPDQKPGKPEARTMERVLARLDASEEEAGRRHAVLVERLSTMREENITLRRSMASLQSVLISVLPAKLLRLNREQIDLLREKAPSTRVQLLAGFKAQTMDLPEGTIMHITDTRIRQYRAMQLALVPESAIDVETKIAELIDESVKSQAAAQQTIAHRRLAEQVARAEAEAASLKSQLDKRS